MFANVLYYIFRILNSLPLKYSQLQCYINSFPIIRSWTHDTLMKLESYIRWVWAPSLRHHDILFTSIIFCIFFWRCQTMNSIEPLVWVLKASNVEKCLHQLLVSGLIKIIEDTIYTILSILFWGNYPPNPKSYLLAKQLVWLLEYPFIIRLYILNVLAVETCLANR